MPWTFTFMLILGIAAYGVNANSFLTPLANYVKSNSDPDVVPMQNNQAVDVAFIYSSINIADVDEEHNTITSEAMVLAKWPTGIVWEPRDFNGLDRIALPKKYFWTPTMQPISTAVEVKDLSPQLVNLFHNGTAAYTSLYRLTGLCDVSNIHTGASCGGKSSMWGYSKDQVNIVHIGSDTTGAIPYFAGSKYEIIGGTINTNEFPFNGKVYQIIDSTFIIREKPGRHRRGPFRAFFQWN